MTGAAMVDCDCDYCGAHMSKRVADRERGWGRFCDKRCKALHQSYGPKVKMPPVVKPITLTPKGNPVIVNKKGEPPLHKQGWATADPKHKVKRPRPPKKPDTTPKPENYGEWS